MATAAAAVSTSWTHHRARVAALSRDRSPNDPELIEARRAMRAERLAQHIATQVNAWPPLTPEQRERLAVLLRGGEGA